MRLFVAVPLPSEIAARAAALLPQMPGVRGVRPEHMHVTLAFLGSVEPPRLADVVDAVRAGCRGASPFEVSLEGLGRFPSGGAPRIVWLGIVQGAPALIRLAESIRAALSQSGLPFDPKPFRAHVTLARVGDLPDRDSLRVLAARIEQGRTPPLLFHAGAVVCFESVVTAQGPRYTPRATVSLEVGDQR